MVLDACPLLSIAFSRLAKVRREPRLEIERDHRPFEDRLVRLFAVEEEMVGVDGDVLFADGSGWR